MAITACLLTRDEAAAVGASIRSLANVVDQVLVVDTGSTDGTPDLAREAGAKVCTVVWADDFAAGRNAALAQARGDWIFWVNPDETYLGPGRNELDALMRNDRVFGYFARILSSDAEDESSVPGQAWDLRLFRNRPGLAFLGRLHPAFDPAIVQKVAEEGLAVELSSLTLRSAGRSEPGPMTEEQARWTLSLIDKELNDRPGQIRYLIEAARLLRRLGDFRADAALAVAAQATFAARGADRPPSQKVQHLLESVIESNVDHPLGPIDRREAIRLTLKWFRDSPPLLWSLAGSHHARGEFAEATAVLEHLVDLGERGEYDHSRPFPAEIVGDQARMNLAACYARIGRADDARRLFASLLSHPKMGADAAKNLRVLG